MAAALPKNHLQNFGDDTENVDPRQIQMIRLNHLVDKTYQNIEELKRLLLKESRISGEDTYHACLGPVMARQSQLMHNVYKVNSTKGYPNNQQEDRLKDAGRKHTVSFKSDSNDAQMSNFKMDKPHNESMTVGRDHVEYFGSEQDRSNQQNNQLKELKHDPSWYGSLDRSFSKRKVKGNVNRRRRHTKTVGSMAGLDFIKQSEELQPDEQYEIGLPRVTSFPSSKMTQIHATLSHPQLPLGWGPRATYMERPIMISPCPPALPQRVQSLSQSHSRQQSSIVEMDSKIFIDSINESDSTFYSAKETQNSRSWFETNLDDTLNSVNSMNLGSVSGSPISPVLSSAIESGSVSGVSLVDGCDESFTKAQMSGSLNDSKSSGSNESHSGFPNESTKPFEMSDYYKYSAKFRNKKSDKGALVVVTPQSSPSYLQQPLTEEKRNALMVLFSQEGTDEANDPQSWMFDELDNKVLVPKRSASEGRQPRHGTSRRGGAEMIKPVLVPQLQNKRQMMTSYTGPSKESGQVPVSTPFTEKSVKDLNGNGTSGVPELPPRLRREAKPTNNKTGEQRSSRNPSTEEGAWVMDTPTFV